MLGDDVGDLPAFRQLGAFADRDNFTAVRIAITSSELPPALLADTDFVLEGPALASAFLAQLAGRVSGES
jgi:hypothetical protein